ncbi:MAG TPA: type IV secretion system DNA-binding domain-containing protein, partial [Candidatus Binataceae bacterium]|nr:type IV secretion system DNA-binding domain-containing protein [Candidatus Binataceae bacterium]
MRLSPSPAAQFQASKTRFLLGLTLFVQLLLTLAISWIVPVMLILWHEIGVDLPDLQHACAGRWMLCSILRDTPFLQGHTDWIWMPLNGGWVQLPDAAAWLNGPDMYQHSFYQAFWYTAGHGWGLMAGLIPLSLVALLVGWRFRHDSKDSEHIRGLRLLTPAEHDCEVNGSRLWQWLFGKPHGLQLGQSIIPQKFLSEHLFYIGNTGSGKTTAIASEVRQIRAWGCPQIIIDREGQFTREFYRPGIDWMLLPLHRDCPYWSPWSELRDEFFTVDAAAMAASMIRGRDESEHVKWFNDSTRTVIEAILHVARTNDPTPESLLEFVGNLERDELHEALRGTPAYPLI